MMQVFLPSENFAEVARILDNQRLNKQALEAWQIMMVNLNLDPQGEHRQPKGWRNHPAVVMWRGHEKALLMYIEAMVTEWIARGYKSTILDKAKQTYDTAVSLGIVQDTNEPVLPAWMHDPLLLQSITSSHREALLCKNYAWYSQFNWEEDKGTQPSDYVYTWAA
jgi:hypothetical protein